MLSFGKLALAYDTCGSDYNDFELCVRGSKWLRGGSFLWRHMNGHPWTWRCNPFLGGIMWCFILELCDLAIGPFKCEKFTSIFIIKLIEEF